MIEANLNNVDFWEINLDWQLNEFKPCCKPNEKLYYINKASNHPPIILKSLVSNIGWCISILSDKTVIQNAKPYHHDALRNNIQSN